MTVVTLSAGATESVGSQHERSAPAAVNFSHLLHTRVDLTRDRMERDGTLKTSTRVYNEGKNLTAFNGVFTLRKQDEAQPNRREKRGQNNKACREAQRDTSTCCRGRAPGHLWLARTQRRCAGQPKTIGVESSVPLLSHVSMTGPPSTVKTEISLSSGFIRSSENALRCGTPLTCVRNCGTEKKRKKGWGGINLNI